MIYRTPEYCRDFRCKAGECRDSCCKGWEIDIDTETAEKYAAVSGDFGKRLQNSIKNGSFLLTEDERCPFLNENGLCDIYINLGEENLCHICSEHPRYYEWFGNVKEGGVGLCCEAAAELILSSPFTLCEEQIADDYSEDEYDEELFGILLEARTAMLNILNNSDIPLDTALCHILDNAEDLQEELDLDFPVFSGNADCSDGLHRIFRIFAELEPIDENWLPFVKSCEKSLSQAPPHKTEHTPYLRRIASYLIFRYFLKSVYDGRILGYTMFAAVSVLFIDCLFRCKAVENGSCCFSDCAELAKNYSKETEYSEENMEKLLDLFETEPAFGVELLKKLLTEAFGKNVDDI